MSDLIVRTLLTKKNARNSSQVIGQTTNKVLCEGHMMMIMFIISELKE